MLKHYDDKASSAKLVRDCVRLICGTDMMVVFVPSEGDQVRELSALARDRWGPGTLGILVRTSADYVCRWTRDAVAEGAD